MGKKPEMIRIPLRENLVGQGLLLASLALLALGVVMVHSAVASVATPGDWYRRVDYRHTAFAAIAAVVLLMAWRVNVYWFRQTDRFPWRAAILLLIGLILGGLVFVNGIGYAVGGYHRWIRLGPDKLISFQPSELIKLFLVVFLAAWLTRDGVNVRSFFKTFLPALALVGACMGLVITQDLGTAMLIGISGGVAMLLAGVPWYYLGTLVGLAGGGGFLSIVLSPWRMARVMAMLDPMSPENKAAYQARESLMAAINGGWWGMGLGNGMIKQGFLPEDSTDFIFAVYCEEWGFRGALLLMGLLLVWMLLARRAAVKSADPFGRVVAGSLGVLIALQAVLHIGVNLVVLPTKGLGFPLVSAGGTSLVIMAAAAAMIVAVTSRQPAEAFPGSLPATAPASG